jgi:hypothetical protein
VQVPGGAAVRGLDAPQPPDLDGDRRIVLGSLAGLAILLGLEHQHDPRHERGQRQHPRRRDQHPAGAVGQPRRAREVRPAAERAALVARAGLAPAARTGVQRRLAPRQRGLDLLAGASGSVG